MLGIEKESAFSVTNRSVSEQIFANVTRSTVVTILTARVYDPPES